MKYIASADYERLVALLEEQTVAIIGHMVRDQEFIGDGIAHASMWPRTCGDSSLQFFIDMPIRCFQTTLTSQEQARKEFINECRKRRLAFIDPTSQRRTSKELAAEEMHEALCSLIGSSGPGWHEFKGTPENFERAVAALKKANWK